MPKQTDNRLKCSFCGKSQRSFRGKHRSGRRYEDRIDRPLSITSIDEVVLLSHNDFPNSVT